MQPVPLCGWMLEVVSGAANPAVADSTGQRRQKRQRSRQGDTSSSNSSSKDSDNSSSSGLSTSSPDGSGDQAIKSSVDCDAAPTAGTRRSSRQRQAPAALVDCFTGADVDAATLNNSSNSSSSDSEGLANDVTLLPDFTADEDT